MCLSRRLFWAVGCLGIGLLAQLALWLHVRAAAAEPFPELRQTLDQLPRELPGAAVNLKESPGTPPVWRGKDHSEKAAQMTRETLAKARVHPDQMVLRQYRMDKLPVAAELYMIYCRDGEDRKHHPEVCIRDVLGAPEDLKARAQVPLDDKVKSKRLAQRFRFRTGAEEHTVVYYWHYTLVSPEREGQTFLQTIHQQLARPSPSITVQFSVREPGVNGREARRQWPPPEVEVVEKSLLPALDAAMLKGHLPPGTLIGNERMAIAIVRQ